MVMECSRAGSAGSVSCLMPRIQIPNFFNMDLQTLIVPMKYCKISICKNYVSSGQRASSVSVPLIIIFSLFIFLTFERNTT
jgi:hypothetical protein